MSNQEQIQVQQQIDDVLTKVSATEDLLAQEKQDGTQEEVQHLRSQLEQLYKERVVLREKQNLLLRAQQGNTSPGWRDPFLHPSHSSIQDAFACVSPVMYKGQCIGSAARITTDGLLISCSHVFVDNGKLVEATAFGDQPLKLVASFPYLDILLLRGPEGPAFHRQTKAFSPGTPVMLLGFPEAPQAEIDGLKSPIAARGFVNAISPTSEVAIADYHGAMPSASGAPVLVDTGTLVGVHTGALFHLDPEYVQEQKQEDAPASRVDKDDQKMWWPQAASSVASVMHSPKRKALTYAVDQAIKDKEIVALHAKENIKHKDQLATFVPMHTILYVAMTAGVMPASSFHQPSSSKMGLKLVK